MVRYESPRADTMKILILLCLLPFLTTACVSVNLGPKPGGHAASVKFSEPPPPFKEMKTDDADKAWQRADNGNTISFTSVCDEPSDPTLETMQASTVSSLQNSKIQKETRGKFNDRESLETLSTGSVDGVSITLRFVVFKRNNCNYTISFVALSKFFETDLPYFDQFLKGFHAP